MNYESRKYVLIAAVLFISSVFILRLFWIQVVDGQMEVRRPPTWPNARSLSILRGD
jgi:cell division protein FtsI/penicillin-binding protein 2